MSERHTLAVRPFTYRGEKGWKLSGSPAGRRHYRVSMFFEHEGAARRTFKRLVEDPDYETTSKDFEP